MLQLKGERLLEGTAPQGKEAEPQGLSGQAPGAATSGSGGSLDSACQLLFIPLRTPAHEMGPPTFRLALVTSVTPPRESLTCIQRLVSGDSSCVTLTIISYRSKPQSYNSSV